MEKTVESLHNLIINNENPKSKLLMIKKLITFK